MTRVARHSVARARARRAAGVLTAAASLAASLAAGLVATPDRARAQATAGRMGPYERALRLVEAGRGTEGRALTDSLVAAAGPGSPALAEALWWRATLAAGADSAERDLRRLIAEVPASPRTGPATVRLAQLALLRDRPDDATRLLEPLVRGRAGDPVRPIAGYWLARARLERRDVAGACAALDGAAGGPVFDTDLARQLAGLRRRVPGCGGAAVAVAPVPAPGASAPAAGATAGASGGLSAATGSTVATGATSGATSAPAFGTASGAAAATPTTAAPTTVAPGTPPPVAAPAAPPVVASAGAASPPPAARPSAAPVGTPSAASAAVRSPVGSGTSAAFAVQVSAYDTRGGADALAARLRAGGLDAFTEGQGAAGDLPPFRVKVGRYATRGAAVAALAGLRRRGLAGFVTSARPAAPAGAR